MKNKVLTAVLVACLLCQCFSMVVYAEAVDYSEYLSELEVLITKCREQGYSTDYEQSNYAVIRRFENNINEDIAAGRTKYLARNKEIIEELYIQGKSNLEAYLAGTKKPLEVKRADTMNVEADGNMLYSSNKPFFSLGYGHFTAAQKDIPNFQSFGTNNIQMEAGVTKITGSEFGWRRIDYGGVVAETSLAKGRNDKYSYHIVNKSEAYPNRFLWLEHSISCMPGETYRFGLYAKGNINGIWISLDGYNGGRNYLTNCSDWTNFEFTYTIPDGTTSISPFIQSVDITDGYLDDMYIYKVDSEGNNIGENILVDAGFESGDKYYANVAYIIDALKCAEESNIVVNLLLSPHYFPSGLASENYAQNSTASINYNIDSEATRTVISEYLNTLIPYLRGYKSLGSICLSNEPSYRTTDFPDFYNPKFREYLLEIHGSLTGINNAYNTSYSDISEITMPTDLSSADAICYDWIEFNDKVFADWHSWMAGIIKNLLPDIPVHAKVMTYITGESDGRGYLGRGTDIELFNSFCDYAGNDAMNWVTDLDFYYFKMFWYDYLKSATGKPIYNSEDHLIGDTESTFTDKMRAHITTDLWQGAVHGRNMSSIWQWERTNNQFQMRADAVADTGRMNLDFARLANELGQLNSEEPKVAIFYSKASRLYDIDYFDEVMDVYRLAVHNGTKVGVISDKSINKLEEYDALIIPGANYCTEETAEKVAAFLNNGGRVLYPRVNQSVTGCECKVFSMNEYGKSIDNSVIKSKGSGYGKKSIFVSDTTESDIITFLNNITNPRVELLDENGNIPDDIDWQYSINKQRFVINMVNLDYTAAKNITIMLDGNPVTGMIDCRTGESGISTVTLNGLEPRMLKISYMEDIDAKIKDIKVNPEGNISWESSTENYIGADIYKLNKMGVPYLIASIDEKEYAADEGTYIVKSQLLESNDGEVITVADGNIFSVTLDKCVIYDSSAFCEVTTENISSIFAAGIIYVQAINKDGSVENYGYNRVVMAPKEKTSLRISMPVGDDIQEVKVSVWDSTVSQNLLAVDAVYNRE